MRRGDAPVAEEEARVHDDVIALSGLEAAVQQDGGGAAGDDDRLVVPAVRFAVVGACVADEALVRRGVGEVDGVHGAAVGAAHGQAPFGAEPDGRVEGQAQWCVGADGFCRAVRRECDRPTARGTGAVRRGGGGDGHRSEQDGEDGTGAQDRAHAGNELTEHRSHGNDSSSRHTYGMPAMEAQESLTEHPLVTVNPRGLRPVHRAGRFLPGHPNRRHSAYQWHTMSSGALAGRYGGPDKQSLSARRTA
ncbi:hypothetical protein GCM10023257_12550 [Streptomyces hyderabadensis]|uniref:Uncharacterized protein n=1 Tax=Streptomyces hyderabadensis TaxID=598549 RepID=A0ABP9HSA8_9ACTN